MTLTTEQINRLVDETWKRLDKPTFWRAVKRERKEQAEESKMLWEMLSRASRWRLRQ